MAVEDIGQAVAEKVFYEEGAATYAVLDGASVDGLLDKIFELEPEHVCLLRGDLAPDMAEVAPYLVKLEPGSEFAQWVFDEGWGKHWGVFASAYAELRDVRSHFRSLLTVYDQQGKPLQFRYYDPRVLRLYLPTCNAEELSAMFGPITTYLLEDEDATTMLRFEVGSGMLKRKKLSLV
jgi:hypothetical protein